MERAARDFRRNALGAGDPHPSPHPLHLALGAAAPERQATYRDLFAAALNPNLLRDLRACRQTGTPLGNDRFRAQIAQALGTPVGYSRRRRPKAKKQPEEAALQRPQIGLDR